MRAGAWETGGGGRVLHTAAPHFVLLFHTGNPLNIPGPSPVRRIVSGRLARLSMLEQARMDSLALTASSRQASTGAQGHLWSPCAAAQKRHYSGEAKP